MADVRDGRIYTQEQIAEMYKSIKQGCGQSLFSRLTEKINNMIPMEIEPMAEQLERKPPRIEIHEPCPCGSGNPFVHCCYKGNHSE